ncbi:hypothetical protein BCR33DRAFT_715327 [Rhizoclosmatium globosum]|uniref:LisH domain-containing protein ARMC9 n=1 Tax=Rhizoclosmatium globosum TaxID=329046 RepID=A0A1Y2CJ43_9FUNG|nr:hypothetical protein BCR33DRAFT_715327 [Rhizoclosmatium globosum]|eukprot:ORY46927.1 hypothetical protein BCR33DRAFT_715327 [Rhizoclosmatium globosum]
MLLDPKREIDTNTLIREYLRYADYRSLWRVPEGDSISSDEDPEAASRLEEVKNRFIIAFHDGDRKEFFKLWDQHFPPKIVKTDPLYQKIEFQVNIYFAVFPIHPFVSPTAAKKYTIQSTMDGFKLFLETRGAELCKTTQFLSFYALPYVPDARAHPSFNELFTERHVTDLDARLQSFLGSALRAAHVPRLLRILNGVDMRPLQNAEESKAEIKALKQQVYEMEDNERELASKHRGLQRDYHNLLTIASELVQTLAACINGEKITPAYLTSICQRVGEFKKNSTVRRSVGAEYEEIQEKDPRGVSKSQSIHNTKPRNTPAPTTAHSRRDSNVANSMHAREPSKSHLGQDVFDNLDTYLDFEMILEDLRKMGDDEMFRKQAFVLQALRMRLTHAPNLAEKRRILRMYLDNDVLGVISGQDVIIPLLQTGPHIVCEQMARFLNTMTSECIGRDYILAGEEAGITAALVTALVNETRDSLYQQNLLGTLQKLSLRRSAQSTMNKMNVLEYSCEYGTALFMNLCLRTAGRKQCLQNPVRTLETLLGLLEIDSMQIQTYVNGALYSILSEPAFRECATSLRLNESLLFLQKSANDQVKGQINFVLEQLYSTDQQNDDAVSEDGADEDEEEDEEDQEPEEDFDQLIPSFPNDKAGRISVSRSVKRNGTGGLAGSGEEPLVRKSTTAIPNQAARELRRPKTPTMRSITPAPVKVQHTGASWPKETNVNASGSKGKMSSCSSKETGECPTTETEIREFNTGFTTRPKLARTPIN